MWLSASLAEWYADAVFSWTNDLGPIGAIAKGSALALALGVVLGIVRRQRSLAWFLAPIAAAHIFVFIAAIYANSVSYPSHGEGVTVPFLIAEVVACAYLVFRLKSARIEALLLTVFVLGYSFFAGFIAQMSLTGDWL